MISSIILSAGESSRFGSPKALASWQGTTVISHILHTLEMTQISEIIVVLGAHQAQIEPNVLNHKRTRVVHNKDHKFGQTSSFQKGLSATSSSSEGYLLFPVDYPAVRADTLNQLISIFLKNKNKIILPTYQQKRGHPPVFPKSLRDVFLNLDVQEGLNSIIHQRKESVQEVVVDDPGVRATFNTPEEWKALKRLLL